MFEKEKCTFGLWPACPFQCLETSCMVSDLSHCQNGIFAPDFYGRLSNAHNTQVLSNPSENCNTSNLLINAVLKMVMRRYKLGLRSFQRLQLHTCGLRGVIPSKAESSVYKYNANIWLCRCIFISNLIPPGSKTGVLGCMLIRKKKVWNMHLHTGIWAEIVQTHSQRES